MVPPVGPVKRVSLSPKASMVAIGNDTGVPTEQSEDSPSLPTGFEAVATSSPGA